VRIGPDMRKRIGINDVITGMYVAELCGSWIEHAFWKTSFLLDNEAVLQKLRASGVQEVIIDTSRGLDIPAPNVPEVTAVALDAPGSTTTFSFSEESRRALQLKNRARDAVEQLFDDARLGKTIDTREAQVLVEDIAGSITRHPHAFISLVRLKHADDYTWLHSVAVCALMMALGRQLKLDEDKIHEVGIAGLFHDIGKIGVPLEILNKPGRLTDEEFEIIKTHPATGAALLSETQQVSDLVIDVCLHHHEKIDGSGYPMQHQGDAISLYARMGAVCDIYDAITSDRPYKKGWQPAEAIRKMADWCNGHLDPAIFQAFVKTLGIYPTGSLVKLNSGRLGIVIEQHAHSLLTPQVMVFFSTRSKVQIPREVIDLASPRVDDKIVGRESPETWGFKHLEHLWLPIN